MAEITYYGHSCFSVKTGGKNILFDPFITPNPKASDVNVDSISPDVILVSHGHGDHVADLVQIAKKSNALVVCVYEIQEWLKTKGVENVIGMNIGGTVDLGFAKAKMVNAIHTSTMPDGTAAGVPAGFVVYNDEDCFYYAGDTALTMDMKLIADDFKLGFAFLPIGDHFTMGIRDAIRASEFIRCDDIIGMHFNTFPPIEIDNAEAQNEFEENGLNLHLMEINQTIEL
ncbi:metal-dependent hydrolase [bacterium]|nr:metal-dependent hydrolase [bacterium]